jgi:hypothetical protein
MGPTDCPETSVKDYHSALRNIPEERTSQDICNLATCVGRCVSHPETDINVLRNSMLHETPLIIN